MTRDEWCKIWESIKTIESLPIIPTQCDCGNCTALRRELKFIKDKIQQEIGQME